MEMHEALEFCLRRLQAEPGRIVALARAIAGPASQSFCNSTGSPAQHQQGAGNRANHTVLRTSQSVLAETLTLLRQENS